MADVSTKLIYEVLKSVRERVAEMDGELDEVKDELTAIRGYRYGIHQGVGNIYSALGRHETRLDRIERRLELREPEPA